jgi:hypothetical protein
MRSAALALSILVVVTLGCDSGLSSGPSNANCPAVAEPAVEVEVSDATTGRYVAAEAEAVITDGSYRDTLRRGVITQVEPTLIVKTLVGGFERPGTYDVSIEHPNYQSWTRSGVEVPSGKCGPDTQQVEASLREKETGS